MQTKHAWIAEVPRHLETILGAMPTIMPTSELVRTHVATRLDGRALYWRPRPGMNVHVLYVSQAPEARRPTARMVLGAFCTRRPACVPMGRKYGSIVLVASEDQLYLATHRDERDTRAEMTACCAFRELLLTVDQ